MTYCPRCDPASVEAVLTDPGKYGDAVFCVACSQHIRAAASKTPEAAAWSDQTGGGAFKTAEGVLVTITPASDDLKKQKEAWKASTVKPTFGVYDDLLLLAESMLDADDADETSPFCVLVLPQQVRTNLERCRVALKRHRRPG